MEKLERPFFRPFVRHEKQRARRQNQRHEIFGATQPEIEFAACQQTEGRRKRHRRSKVPQSGGEITHVFRILTMTTMMPTVRAMRPMLFCRATIQSAARSQTHA